MSARINFEKMKKVASEVFGEELVRAGKKFKFISQGVALGEGHGELWTLKDIHSLFSEWLSHPEWLDFLSPTLQDEVLVDNLRKMALAVGIRVADAEDGFHLFDLDTGEQLGLDDDPWTFDSVVDFCQKLEESKTTGVFVA